MEELRGAVDERRRMVSSKVARLMHAPRRPALERSGIAQVSERARLPEVRTTSVREHRACSATLHA